MRARSSDVTEEWARDAALTKVMSEERPFEVPEGPKGTNEEGRDEAALTGFSDETPMGVARGMKAVNEGGNQGWGAEAEVG